jgi:hypothetical protein
MPKILSQAGDSLADAYDVVGSIAGVEDLITADVQLLHEMGGTIFSERITSQVLTIASGSTAQNSSFTGSFEDAADSPTRILGIQVLTSTAGRVQLASVSILQSDGGQEQPIFVFDSTDDEEGLVSCTIDGGASALYGHLSPRLSATPVLMTRMGNSNNMPHLKLRGLTEGFGAGTVQITALVLIARAGPGVPVAGTPESHGLPIPSW